MDHGPQKSSLSSLLGGFLIFFNFFFSHLDPLITRIAGTYHALPFHPETQEGVCLNMQAQRQDLCILYRKLLLFAAGRIHNVLSTGDQDVGLYKHQAAIPYITIPGGEQCVMRRNSFARKGKTQEFMEENKRLVENTNPRKTNSVCRLSAGRWLSRSRLTLNSLLIAVAASLTLPSWDLPCLQQQPGGHQPLPHGIKGWGCCRGAGDGTSSGVGVKVHWLMVWGKGLLWCWWGTQGWTDSPE